MSWIGHCNAPMNINLLIVCWFGHDFLSVNVSLLRFLAWSGFLAGLRSGWLPWIRSRCSRKCLGDGMVARFFGFGFRHFDFRSQLINDLVLRTRQCFLLRFVDASVLLIEVEDVGRENKVSCQCGGVISLQIPQWTSPIGLAGLRTSFWKGYWPLWCRAAWAFPGWGYEWTLSPYAP